MTTVLATDRARPNTRPACHDQPSMWARPAPISVATTIWMIVPGTTMRATDIRSLSEKCSPTPNISRMTPISASSAARPASAVKPGVNGPTTMPATQIADQRLDSQAMGQQSEHVGQHQAGRDHGDQRCLMFRYRLFSPPLELRFRCGPMSDYFNR